MLIEQKEKVNKEKLAHLLCDVPLLAKVSRMHIAKLVTDLEITHLTTDDTTTVGATQTISLVVSGELEVVNEAENILLLVGPGDLVGEACLLPEGLLGWKIRAIEPSLLVHIPLDRFESLLAENPSVAQQFHAMVLRRSAGLLKELGRTKEVLSTYASEIWGRLPQPRVLPTHTETYMTNEYIAAAAQTASEVNKPSVTSQSPMPEPRRYLPPLSLVGGLFGVVAGAMIALIPSASGAITPLNIALGLLVAAGINWLIGVIPDYAVALTLCVGAVLFGIATPVQALSGFASPAWFLILSVWVTGIAVTKSGLLYRLALYMLSLLPPTFSGQAMALILAGLAVMPLMPNGQSRLGMVAPLIKELAEVLRIKKGSRGVAGLAMSALISFGLLYFLVPNGSTVALLAWSLLPPEIQSQMTWPFWLAASLPIALSIAGIGYWHICWRYRPETPVRISHELIRLQLRILGPMSRTEWLTAGVLFTTLGGFMFVSKLTFDPAWIATLGMLVLLGGGIVDKISLRRNVDWGFLLFFGAVMSFSNVVRIAGLEQMLDVVVGPLLSGIRGNSYAFVFLVSAVTFVARLFVPTYQCVPLLLIAFNPIALSLGFNPFVSSVIIIAFGANFLIPRQNLFYMVLHSGMDETFAHKDALEFAAVHCTVLFVSALATVPIWQAMGLLP